MKKFIEFLIENEEIDREDVRRILWNNSFEIVDGKVNVNTSVNLFNKSLKSFPFNFGIIDGHFYCHNNQLISLKGCPQKVNGNFDCANNKLTSLEGCPEKIKKYFDCSHNQLISLKGCQEKINGSFDCSNNQLKSLKGCPEIINKNFYCSNNQLTSLKGCPNEVNISFVCYNNPLVDISDIVDKKIKELDCDCDKLNITIGNCKALKQTNNIDKVDWYLDTDSEEELQLYAIKQDPENIKKILDPVDNVVNIIKKEYPELIRYLPYDKQTKLSRYGL